MGAAELRQVRVMLMFYCVLIWLVQVDITHILQGYSAGIGAIIWLPQCQWSYPDEQGEYITRIHKKWYLSGHEGEVVMLPGFAIIW